MSGFIANGTAAADNAITSDPFWPEVSPDQIRSHRRIDGSVTKERLRAVVVDAVSMVNDEFQVWKLSHVAAGYAALTDVPAPTIDGASRLVLLYQRAVACCAAAELAERYRSYDATDSANQRADDLTPSIDELRRDQRWAIRDFLGVRRVTVELI